MKQEHKFGVVRIAEYDNDRGLMIQAAIVAAGQRKLRILSNLELDKRLVGSDQWKSDREMYPCWSGTLIAYEKPDVAFGKIVAFSDLVVNVPKQFRGRVNSVLVCNHPDYNLKGGVVTLGKSVRCLSFPVNDGWYLTDKDFGIPTGIKISLLNKDARYLWRRNNSNYVGLVARGYGVISYRRDVICYDYGSGRFGVFGSSVGEKTFNNCKHKWIKVCKVCGAERRIR